MKQIIKINAVSILYALFILVPIELMVNVYRISRLSGWDIDTVNKFSGVSIVILMVIGTLLVYLLTIKWLGRRKLNYITAILWVPYFILFVYIIAALFPMTYRGDTPNPAAGLIAIGTLIAFPIYILLINSAGSMKRFG